MEDNTTAPTLFPSLPAARRALAIAAHRKLHELWSKSDGPSYVKKEWQSFEDALFALAAPDSSPQGELGRVSAQIGTPRNDPPAVDDHPMTLADIHVNFEYLVAAEDTPADELRTVARRLLDEVARLQNLLGDPIRRKPYPDVKLRCAYPTEGVYVGWERHDTRSGSYHPMGGILLSLNEAVWFARCFIDMNHGRDALVTDFQAGIHAELAAVIENAVAPVIKRCKDWATAADVASVADLPPPALPERPTAVVEGPTLPEEFVADCYRCKDGTEKPLPGRLPEPCWACKGSRRLYFRAAPEKRP